MVLCSVADSWVTEYGDIPSLRFRGSMVVKACLNLWTEFIILPRICLDLPLQNRVHRYIILFHANVYPSTSLGISPI